MPFTPFGIFLHKLRRQHGEVLYHMAKRMNETTPTISKWQTGATEITPAICDRIRAEYEMPIETFVEMIEAFALTVVQQKKEETNERQRIQPGLKSRADGRDTEHGKPPATLHTRRD